MLRLLAALTLSSAAPTFAATPQPVVFQVSAEAVGRTANLDSLSYDGRVIGGSFVDGSMGSAFRYSPEGGFQILGTDLPEGTIDTWVNGMSDTGDILFGTLWYTEDSVDYRESFRWTSKSGFKRLGQVPESTYSFPTAISSNDRILAGTADTGSGFTSFFWSEKEGLKDFPSTFAGFPTDAWSPAWISNNGKSIWATGSGATKCVIRWTHGKEPVVYRDLPGGADSIQVTAVTASGKEAFGHATTQDGQVAVKFTNKGQVQPLVPHLSDYRTMVTQVTPGGRFVIGTISPRTPSSAQPIDSFILDLKTGQTRNLSSLIYPHPPSAVGMTNFFAKAISGDGNIIIGHGYGPLYSDDWKITGAKAILIQRR